MTTLLDSERVAVVAAGGGGIVRGPVSGDPTPGVLAATGSGTTITATWAAGNQPAAGSKVIIFVQANGNMVGHSTVTDNGTTPSTFTIDKGSTAGKGTWIYRADNITLPASGKYAVKFTMTLAALTLQIGGIAYTGVAAGGPSSVNNGSGTSTAPNAGAVTPAGAGGLYVGMFSDLSGLNPETIALNWAAGTQEFKQTNGSAFWCMGAADSVTGTSAQAPAWTLGDSVGWGAVSAVYEAAR